MPEKSVREMNEKERRRNSLQAKVFNATLLNCFIIGLVALLIGLGFYTFALSRQLISQAYNIASSAHMSVTHAADPIPLAEDVLETYKGLDYKARGKAFTDEYRQIFEQYTHNPSYIQLEKMLKFLLERNDIFDLYIATYDYDTEAIVYIVDADFNEETKCYPGDWERFDGAAIKRFYEWDGKSELYNIYYSKGSGFLCTAAYPIQDESGEAKAFILADLTLEQLSTAASMFVISFTIATLAVIAFIVLWSTKRMQRTIVSPINRIADACQGYMNDRRAGRELADHFAMLNIRTGDEIENLSTVMADMEQDLASYVDDLTRVTAEKERISTELDLATRIQAAVLPNIFPPFPDRKEFDIYASMDPAKEVGGDFYDFFMIDKDHLAMVIADVSGKGVPAALFMMTSRTMIKDVMLSGLGPAAAIERVNAQLSESNSLYMFVTVWIGVLETSTGRLVWADAGHEKPILRSGGSWKVLEKHESPAVAAFEPEILALDPSPAFVDNELQLEPGDVIFQYTDGVTEAMTKGRTQFGEDRLLKALEDAPSTDPEAILPFVRNRINEFICGADQFDDITMLAVRFNGPAEGPQAHG